MSPTTTATFAFRVVDLANNPNATGSGQVGTKPTGAYNWGIVAFNNVETRTLTGI